MRKSQIIISDENFHTEVINSQIPVIVEVSANWCGATQIIKPIIHRMVSKYHGKIKFGELDFDDNQKTVLQYGVTTIPTILIFINGNLKDMKIGTFSNDELDQLLESILMNK